MAIQDLAGNALPVGTTGQMLGFAESLAPPEVLPQRMYQFLLEPIRIEDAKQEGTLFLKRFLQGPQDVWADTQARIFGLKNLWNLTKIEDRLLVFLKNIVGWTKELDVITEELEPALLRKLIGASIPLWRKRGTEDTILSIMSLVTGTRARMWNWFDYRWITDETGIGEEHEGRDPWIIDLPSDGTSEHEMTLRIVDDGNLNRDLVENLLKRLMRPVGERIEVAYITFLDLFQLNGDDLQWGALNGAGGPPTVEGGTAILPGALDETFVVVDGSLLWSNYVVYWRVRTTAVGSDQFHLIWYATDDDNDYRVAVDYLTQKIILRKQVANSFIDIVTFDPQVVLGLALSKDVWYGFRVQTSPEGAANRIKVYLDADLIIDTTDSAHTGGTVGFAETSPAEIEVDEIELFQLPLDTTLIDINS